VTHEDHVLNRIFGNVLIWKIPAQAGHVYVQATFCIK
jgi:hypothetical protein